MSSLLDKPLGDFGARLSTRILNLLHEDRITTVRDLVRKQEHELTHIPRFSRGALDEVELWLNEQDPRLHLGMSEEEIAGFEATSQESPSSESRAQEILAAMAETIVGCTSPSGMSRLMSFGASPTLDDEPGVLVALMLAQKAKLTSVEYQMMFGPAVSRALANLIKGKKVTIEF